MTTQTWKQIHLSYSICVGLLAILFCYLWLEERSYNPSWIIGKGTIVTYDCSTNTVTAEVAERVDPNFSVIDAVEIFNKSEDLRNSMIVPIHSSDPMIDKFDDPLLDKEPAMSIDLDKVCWHELSDPMIKLEGINGSMSFVHIDNIKSFEKQKDGTYTVNLYQGPQQIIWLKKPDEFTYKRIIANL